MTASEKVAYLKGLADGLGVDECTKEGRLMLAMIDVMESLAKDVEDLEANVADIADSIDDIGEDMSYLEDLALAGSEFDDDDFEEDPDDFECDGNCAHCSGCSDEDQAEYEVVCPACGETVTVYEDDLAFGSIPCPVCGEELEFDLEEDDE